jgi:hypothetical protein
MSNANTGCESPLKGGKYAILKSPKLVAFLGLLLFISEIETKVHGAVTVGVVTTGFVGVGGVAGVSVLLHAKTNKIPKANKILFMTN